MMKLFSPGLLILFALLTLNGCSPSEPEGRTSGSYVLQNQDNSSDAKGKSQPGKTITPSVPSEPTPEKEQSPDEFQVKFTTTKGDFLVKVHRDWAPYGADRFYRLVKEKHYDDCGVFRVLKNFVVQFGISGDPSVTAEWSTATIPDDKPNVSNKKGTITFASRGPNTRTTQIFINYYDNAGLDGKFMPFAEVVEGMKVVNSFNDQYGPQVSNNQQSIKQQGNTFLKTNYPDLDYILTARIVGDAEQPSEEKPTEEKQVEEKSNEAAEESTEILEESVETSGNPEAKLEEPSKTPEESSKGSQEESSSPDK